MPIIKQKDIYDDSKGTFDKLLADLDKLNTEVVTLTKSNVKLAQSLQTVKKTSDGAEARKLVETTEKLKKSTTELTAVQKQRLSVKKQLNTILAKNITANEKSNKILAKGKLRLQENNKLLKQQAKEALGLVGAYEKLTKKTLDAQKKFKNLAVEFGVNSKQAKNAKLEFEKLDNKLSKVNKTARDGKKDVGRYQLAFRDLGTQLVGAVGITAGIALVTSQFKKASERLSSLNKLTRQLAGTFNITTDQAEKLASKINAIALNFEDVDVKQLQTSLTSIVKTFDDISEQEALALIQEGFSKGSNNSGEFLDILKEYPVQFKAAGIDAQTMFAIINQQVKQGIYSDKGVDAIKEGGLRLRENTKAVQEALKPFDDYTKQQIKLAIEAGNSFEAIQLVSKGLEDTSLTAEETQTIIADVFGGAGEDAGLQYILTLQDIQSNLNNVKKETSLNQEANIKLTESYNNFLTSVSDGDGIISNSIATIKSWGTEILTTFTKFNQVDFVGKAKLMTNGVLALFGVGEDYRFSVEKQTEALKLNRIETDFAVRKTKEQREALAKTEEETVKLTAAQIKAIQAQKDLNAARKNREGFADDIPSTVSGGGVVTSVSDPVADKKSEVDQKLELDQWYLDQKAEQIVIADEVAREDALEREIEFQEAKAELINEFEQLGAQLAIDIFNSIQDEKIAKIQADADTQIKILEDQLDKGVISEEEFTKKKEAIEKRARIKSAEAEKKKAIWEAVIATALAIVKAAPSIIKMALAAVIGGIQIAVIAAKPIPQFAEGEVDINAPSHALGGKDVNIEGGESIIKTKATRDSKGLLNMIQDGIVTDKTPFGNYNDMDMRGLIDKFDENTKEAKRTNHLLGNLYSSHTIDGFLHKKTTAGLETKQPLK